MGTGLQAHEPSPTLSQAHEWEAGLSRKQPEPELVLGHNAAVPEQSELNLSRHNTSPNAWISSSYLI